jgi:hypothetical protein
MVLWWGDKDDVIDSNGAVMINDYLEVYSTRQQEASDKRKKKQTFS